MHRFPHDNNNAISMYSLLLLSTSLHVTPSTLHCEYVLSGATVRRMPVTHNSL